ncbi:hypothetical protein EDD15DRAFT_2366492 [Pisolithus albus]|nr:hypothetical protein EDD15DRAFT_2366492 [Pisolithus albus]
MSRAHKPSSDLPVKIGPPVGVRRSQRIKGNPTMSPTKVQPVRKAKSHHQTIKAPRSNQDATTGDEADVDDASGSVARHPSIQPRWARRSSQGTTDEECEQQYLDSFCTKMVTLNNGEQLHPHVALQQLCAGLISKDEIVEDGDRDEASPCKSPVGKNAPEEFVVPVPSVDESTSPHADMDSETEEQVVEDVMQPQHREGSTVESSDESSDCSTDERSSVGLEQAKREIRSRSYDVDYHSSTPPREFPSSEDEGADSENDHEPEESSVNLKRGRLPMEAIRQAQALGMCTTQEAQAIADKYGKTLVSIMTAASLTSKATRAESVWNLHQAWYAHANPKTSRENMTDYYRRQAKHYEEHKDEEEYPQLWAEIRAFWNENISGTKDTSSKAMVGRVMACRDSFTQVAQTWCNVEGIHGIFAGSPVCMQLACEKQTDISKLLDYLATIVKYKALDSAASVPLPNFAVLSQVPYDRALALKPQESRRDRNRHVLPVVFMHKLHEVNLVGGQKNVPWKTLLDVLYTAQYTITDWPVHVPAVGPDFNIRRLNADELRALVVPFLKEQMGLDYNAEAPGEDEDQDGPMIVPSSSFHLKKWTSEQVALFRLADPGMFNIPLVVTTSNKPLRILSDSQAFLRALPRGLLPPRNRSSSPLPPSSPPEASPQSPQSKPSSSSSTDELPQQPVRGDVHVLPMYRIPIVVPLHHAPDIIHANVTGIINSVRAIMICPHRREGTITVSSDMSIEIFHVSAAMAMIQMMTIIAVTIMWATKDRYTPLIPQRNAS